MPVLKERTGKNLRNSLIYPNLPLVAGSSHSPPPLGKDPDLIFTNYPHDDDHRLEIAIKAPLATYPLVPFTARASDSLHSSTTCYPPVAVALPYAP